MPNPYYNVTGWPTTGGAGSSAPARAELALIAAGFALLPTLTGNGSKAVVIDSAGTAITTTTGTLTLAGNFATSGAFSTTLTATGATNVTLPTTGTLATLAGTETLTNKTVNLTSNTLVATSAQLAAAVTDETGSGALVFATSPTLVTPVLGVATATSVNKVAVTAPATSATLTIADGATLATSGAFSTTLTATGATNVTLPTTGTLATLAGTETLTSKTYRMASADRMVYAGTNGDITQAAAATNGQLLVGSTGAAPVLAALTAGSGVTITNGAGSITIATSGGGQSFPGAISMSGVSYPRVFGHNLSTGNNDLYTVPAGKRALVMAMQVYNQSAGNISWYPAIKISATYYRLASNTTTSTLAVGSNAAVGYIAEAGETVAIVTATNNGANVYARVIEFDDSVDIYSSKLTTLSAGANTVYTCPASTSALLLDQQLLISVANFSFIYINASGGSRTVYWHVVPSGSAAGANYQATASTAVADGARSQLTGTVTLSAGDFVSINTDAATATQMAWVNVMEIPT
jgi:hypothetical protein